MGDILNEVGLRLTADQEWVYPFVEVDGVWRTRQDVEWAPGRPAADPAGRAEMVAAVCGQLEDFTRDGVEVLVRGQVSVVGADIVEVQIRGARDVVADTQLDVDNGRFHFFNPPVDVEGEHDPAERLRLELVRVIKGLQQP